MLAILDGGASFRRSLVLDPRGSAGYTAVQCGLAGGAGDCAVLCDTDAGSGGGTLVFLWFNSSDLRERI